MPIQKRNRPIQGFQVGWPWSGDQGTDLRALQLRLQLCAPCTALVPIWQIKRINLIGCMYKPRVPPISRNNMPGEQKSIAALSNTRQIVRYPAQLPGVALLPDSSRALLSTAIPPLLPCSVACSTELLLAPQALEVFLHQPHSMFK